METGGGTLAVEKWMRLADTLGQLGVDVLSEFSITTTSKGFADPRILAKMLMARTLSNFKGVIFLLGNDLVLEARILARCCYENSFWIAALVQDGDKFAAKMRRDDVRSRRSRSEQILTKYHSELPDDIKKTLHGQIRRMNRERSPPKSLNPQNVARNGPLDRRYEVYSQLSADAGDPSLTSLARYMTRSVENGQIVLGADLFPTPKKEEILLTWDWACDAVLLACAGVNEILGGTPAGDRLEAVLKQYNALKVRRPRTQAL
jgi:Family of unknown function (DUF5677)